MFIFRRSEVKQCRTAPFGLKTTPACASAVSGEARLIVMARCAAIGLYPKIHVYLDDFLSRTTRKTNAELSLREITTGLEDLGLDTSEPKTVKPTRQIQHLGRGIDSDRQVITIKESHRQHAKELMNQFLRENLPTRDFHHLCGLLNYLEAVFASRPRIRPFWDHLRRLKINKRKKPTVPEDLLIDATWWMKLFLQNQPGAETPWRSESIMPKVHAATDASGDWGAGGWFQRDLYSQKWDDQFKPKSVPYKELYATAQLLHEQRLLLTNKCVCLYTDSITNVFGIAAGTSRSPECHHLLRLMSYLQRKYNFLLVVKWLPRECNIVADLLSKGKLKGQQYRSSVLQLTKSM